MRIRLGYVAIALNLEKVTSSSTLTYSRYLKLNENERLKKLKEVTYSNIDALEKILRYNIDNNIHFYRMTSNLIPLATHPDIMWDYLKYFRKDLEYIGKIIKDNNLRVDAHPDQFNVINSDKENVVENTIKNLNMQVDLFEAMKYEEGKMVIHIGGAKGGKDIASQRFIENLDKFPKRIVERLILENDDKTFNAMEVLDICNKTNLPMVFDIHHHNCNKCNEDLEILLPEIFKTWDNDILVPKMHFSSPREFENDRKHSDYIDTKSFLEFIYTVKEVVNKDFDIMIEAKKKDITLNKLVNDLKNFGKNIEFIDESTIQI